MKKSKKTKKRNVSLKKEIKTIIKKEEVLLLRLIKKYHLSIRNLIDKTIGLRIFKTALAVTLSQIVSGLYGSRSYFAGISAVITLQNSISSTFSSGIDRILGTIVGLIVGLIFYESGSKSTVALFIGTLSVIKLCIFLTWKNSVSLSVVIFMIVIYFKPSEVFDSVYSFGILRLVDSAVGVVSSIIVNHFIYSPKHEDKEYYH